MFPFVQYKSKGAVAFTVIIDTYYVFSTDQSVFLDGHLMTCLFMLFVWSFGNYNSS